MQSQFLQAFLLLLQRPLPTRWLAVVPWSWHWHCCLCWYPAEPEPQPELLDSAVEATPTAEAKAPAFLSPSVVELVD